MGDIHSTPPLVRIHSQCLTGDVFGSLRCDCRLQLELALSKISQEGAGILLYEQQEGRGIGIMAKLRAYELQDHGRDTVEANEELGYAADCRAFELPAEVLKLMNVSSVRLITNNPEKVAALEAGWHQRSRSHLRRSHPSRILRKISQDQAGKDGPHLRSLHRIDRLKEQTQSCGGSSSAGWTIANCPSPVLASVGAYWPSKLRRHQFPVLRFSSIEVNQYCHSTART